MRLMSRWPAPGHTSTAFRGDTIDFMLSPKRDLTAAKLFLRLALSGSSEVRQRVVNVDGHPAYARPTPAPSPI
jgi:transposase-like protein